MPPRKAKVKVVKEEVQANRGLGGRRPPVAHEVLLKELAKVKGPILTNRGG